MDAQNDPELFDKVVTLCKVRGFVFPTAEIYGGFRSTYDYGPLGSLMLRNVKQAWWRSMVQLRDDVVGLDAAILSPPAVWEASGHLSNFTDPMVDCRSCKDRWRADTIGDTCPNCGSHDLTEARAFNLMAERLGALEERNERLRTQLLTIQEEERADLARDLHDDVGPFLFAVNVDVASITRLAEEHGDAEILERGRSIREAVSHMQKHVKSILGRLRPTGVSEIGLFQAVENLGVFWRRRHPEISIELDVGAPNVSFGDVADATLYRLIQESLTNAIRHGQPRCITVSIRTQGRDEILLEVSDDGVGLNASMHRTGLGLAGMKERISALGGTLSVRNHIDGKGASVTACLPRQAPVPTPETEIES